MPTNSPCIGVCRLDNEYCRGCKRHVSEIVDWYNYTNKQKEEVIRRIQDGRKVDSESN
jgi:predicted Fe-S protein YdhL (DUF1289 family)